MRCLYYLLLTTTYSLLLLTTYCLLLLTYYLLHTTGDGDLDVVKAMYGYQNLMYINGGGDTFTRTDNAGEIDVDTITAYYLPRTTYYSLLTTYYLLLTTYYVLLTTDYI